MQDSRQHNNYVASGNTYCQLIHDLKRWNIGIPPVMEELPTVYWMPKLRTYESLWE